MSSVACRICLRTNVPTLDLPDQLKMFHDELCNFESVQHKRLKYCALCAHQMKKCYKFKGQCLQANGLLKLWIKHKNKDISEYHKELPSTSLQFTDNSTSYLFQCVHEEKTSHNINVTSDCNRKVLKLNSSAVATDDRMHPESSKLRLNSNRIPDRPYPDLRPAVRLSSGLKPTIRPNIGSRPALRSKFGLRPSLRPYYVIQRGEHVIAENGMLTIDPNLQSRPAFKPNLGLKPAFKPNLGLKPAFKPYLRPALIPNSGLGLSIQLVPSGCKQPKQTNLTFDPDFDTSYETDPLTVVKDESAVDIDENTMESFENNMDIGEEESVIKIEKQEVYMDDDTIDIDDAISSVLEIEQKEVDNNECIIAGTKPEEEELCDNDSMDNTIYNKEELINNENDMDNDINSEEYTYEYLEQDIDLLDFATKSKQEESSEATSIEKKQAKKTTVKEPQVTIIKIEDVSDKNVEQAKSKRIPRKYVRKAKVNLNPAQNETNIPLQAKSKRIPRKYVRKAKVNLNLEHTFESPGFKAVPTFKDKMVELLDESPFVLGDRTVLTKDLFSVIYDKFTQRELKRLAVIVLEDDFRTKLTANLTVLYRKYNPDYESVFHVEYLHTEEMKKEEFKRRALHPDYIHAAYKCDLCYKTYTGQRFLDSHKKIYHDPAGPFICYICSYSMRTRNSLIVHRFKVHQAAYTCKLCPLRTNLEQVMWNHYNSHKGAKYECPVCLKICYNETTLHNHKRTAHATHVCTTCAQQYTTEKGLRIHRETQHKDNPPVEPAQVVSCTVCDITFDTRQSYQRHCTIVHAPLPVDRSSFSRRRILPPPTSTKVKKNEKKKKQNVKLYKTCEICHEKVNVEKSGALLYKHFLDKHPGVPYHATGMKAKDYLCDECGKAFYCLSTLREHKNSHTGLRPFMCELCPASFHTKHRRWAHRIQTHCDRRHRCEECGKMFKNAAHLSTHMKIHIGDRNFKCQICDKSFIHNSSLKEHVKGVHYKERRVKKRKKPDQEI